MVGGGSEAGYAETVRKEQGQRQGQQPEAPTSHKLSKPFPCQAGLDVWEVGWSPEKRTYCCILVPIDCRVLGFCP